MIVTAHLSEGLSSQGYEDFCALRYTASGSCPRVLSPTEPSPGACTLGMAAALLAAFEAHLPFQRLACLQMQPCAWLQGPCTPSLSAGDGWQPLSPMCQWHPSAGIPLARQGISGSRSTMELQITTVETQLYFPFSSVSDAF